MRHRLDATLESFESPRIAPRIAKDKPLGRTQTKLDDISVLFIKHFLLPPYRFPNTAARGETENISIARY
jgi:hypothetical protein